MLHNANCANKTREQDHRIKEPVELFCLTLKAPITTAADDIHKYFHCFSDKIRLAARQRIHLKRQALFSSKDKSQKIKCRLLQFLFGALRVKK